MNHEYQPSTWWEMRCDSNHSWWRLQPGEDEPPARDLTCAVDAQPAITVSAHPLADRVVFTLIPAAWEREGSVGFKNDYFLEISNAAGTERLRSGVLSLDEARAKLDWFVGIPWQDAKRRWLRSPLRHEDPLRKRFDDVAPWT